MAKNTAMTPPITTEEINSHRVIATPVKRYPSVHNSDFQYS